MTKKLKNIFLGITLGVLVAVAGSSVVAQSQGLGSFLTVNDYQFLLKMMLNGGVTPETPAFGGTTSDDWNVGGNLTVTGTLNVTGESNLDTLVQGGDLTTLWNNATATAAQICNSGIIQIKSEATTTLGIPTAATLIADCIPTIGDQKRFTIWNRSTSTDWVTVTIKPTAAEIAPNTTVMLEHVGGNVLMRENTFAIVDVTTIAAGTTTISVMKLQDAD